MTTLPFWLTWPTYAPDVPKSKGQIDTLNPKPKREPARWRPMTNEERDTVLALGRCRLPPWSCTKRMVHHLVAQTVGPEPRITDKQAVYLWKFAHKFRRQLPSCIQHEVRNHQ